MLISYAALLTLGGVNLLWSCCNLWFSQDASRMYRKAQTLYRDLFTYLQSDEYRQVQRERAYVAEAIRDWEGDDNAG